MDRRERRADFSTAMLAAFQGLKAEMWSALPGIIQSFDPVKMTCVVQPTIQALWRDPLGNESWQTMPLCLDCPVLFPSGGGLSLTFPLEEGDECLLIFSSRCIDAWWQSGGIGVQAELRMHDLSDGFCVPGPRSQPRVLPGGVAMNAVQLRSDDGLAHVLIEKAAPHNIGVLTAGEVVIESATKITATAPEIHLNGHVIVNGAVSQSGGDSSFGGKVTATDFATAGFPSYITHRHLDAQGGFTGPTHT